MSDEINTAALRDYADHACFIDADARELLVRCAAEIERLRAPAKPLGEEETRIIVSRDAMLRWHEQLLPETVRPQSCIVIPRHDVSRLVDDLIDAALSLSECSALEARGERRGLEKAAEAIQHVEEKWPRHTSGAAGTFLAAIRALISDPQEAQDAERGREVDGI